LTYLLLKKLFLCVRTTVDLSDDLFIELKRVAAESRRTLKELIEDAIRCSLARGTPTGRTKESQRIITFRGRGVQPGVNLDSMRELLDIMEGSP
jgi:hypothetical protein